MRLVSATKGLEANTLLTMSQMILAEQPTARVGVLSGPSFAHDVARGDPTAAVIAAADAELARDVQQAFGGSNVRLYTSSDPLGTEYAGALKNVIAIGAGICDGLGLGSNSLAALITRGLAEITRLACALGGRRETLAGLAGLGDLVLTCTGAQSRNRTLGGELARGRKLDRGGVRNANGSGRRAHHPVRTGAGTSCGCGNADHGADACGTL